MESGKPGLVSGQHSKEKTDRCLWHHSPPREAWLLLILKPEPYWFGGRGVEDSRVWPSQSNCQATVVSEGSDPYPCFGAAPERDTIFSGWYLQTLKCSAWHEVLWVPIGLVVVIITKGH